MNRPAVGVALLLALCMGGQSRAHGETIAVFTKNQGPIFAALRAGAAVAAKNLGVQLVNYVPSTPDSVAEQNKLVDDAIKDKPDAIVFVPVKFTEADGAVKKINAARHPADQRQRAARQCQPSSAMSAPTTYALARETGRYLLKAMNGNGSVVVLDGPDEKSHRRGPRPRVSRRHQGISRRKTPRRARWRIIQRAEAKKVMAGFLSRYPQIRRHSRRQRSDGDGCGRRAQGRQPESLVVGINASREVMDLIKSGDVIGSGDYDTFAQGCLAVEMAVRAIRKEQCPARS